MPFKKYKKSDDTSYALGLTLTFELLKNKPQDALRVYIHSSINKNEYYEKLINLCKETETEVVYSDKPFHILSEKENVFVIGVFKKFETPIENSKNHVVLVNPSNSGNLGTIMRSALGFGIENIAIIRPGIDKFDPKVVRASMGAIFSMNVEYFDSFEDYMKVVKKGEEENNFKRRLYPFMLKAVNTPKDIEKGQISSLIFGNEATGLPDEYLEIGTPVLIKITDKIDSLNLTIAAGIAMYELYS